MFPFFVFLVAVIGPAVFWWYFFIWQDRSEPEPRKMLIKAFFLGIGVALMASALEEVTSFALFPDGEDDVFGVVGQITTAIIISLILYSVIEEAVKFLAVRWFIYPKNYFNQIADGVFYAVAIAIGFIVIENSVYFYLLYMNETAAVFAISAMLRGIATVLMHITSAGIIGYAFGKMKFTAGHSRKIVFKGLVFAMALHVIFNLLIAFEMVELAFIVTFVTFLYLLKMLNKKESKLVWKLIMPKKTG